MSDGLIYVESLVPEINDDMTGALGAGMLQVVDSVRTNFLVGGRAEPWRMLYTGEPSHLFQTGEMYHGIHGESDDQSFTVMTNPWAGNAIHQFGGWSGRGHAAFIVARPYMVLQPDDWRLLEATLINAIINLPTHSEVI